MRAVLRSQGERREEGEVLSDEGWTIRAREGRDYEEIPSGGGPFFGQGYSTGLRREAGEEGRDADAQVEQDTGMLEEHLGGLSMSKSVEETACPFAASQRLG